MRTPRLLLLAVTVGALAAACHPVVPHPWAGTDRYLCCNLHYEKLKTSDLNPTVGTLVPFGTKVTIIQVRKDQVEFQPVGHPTITLDYHWGRKTQPFETYLQEIFVDEDPHAKLRRAKVPAKRINAIDEGRVEVGMTRDQVLMAIGYPPAHETPSLQSREWRYWRTRWDGYSVFFDDNDRVMRVVQ
jgi:hypothetical protein